jgi:uncharacterized repeat protein (TIGR03806 family)
MTNRQTNQNLSAGVFLVAFCGALMPGGAALASETPFGLETRVPWQNTRLMGSPEPPLPYTVEKVFTNITWRAPIFIADEPGTDQLLVVLAGGESERPSRILRVKDDVTASAFDVFFELPRRLIYSLCFHPGYVTNKLVYVFSNGPTGASPRTNRVSRFKVTGAPPHIDSDSEQTIIEWTSSGHDGGDLAFGRDGMLYLTTGDGSTDSDTLNSGQTMDDLLANVLRIDVDHPEPSQPYRVPSDNPFVNLPGARPEIWAYGFRNPWRMCVDRKTGHVWVGNNGQDLWETAQLVKRGENYGWSIYEGSHPFYPGRKRGPTPHVPPTIEHSHGEFRSLTGGVVYYGTRFPELDGVYVYGDYGTGRIWGMKHDGRRALWHRELADTALQIAAFRVDQRGDLLIVDHGGGIYRLVPALRPKSLPKFPARLSETGLFTSVKEHRVAAGLIPYSVKAAGWADGAQAERFMAVPGSAQAKFDVARGWEFPDGSALVQTLSLEREPGNPASRARIETRVLLRQQGEWAGYTYRWKDNQSDAVLVPKGGAEERFRSSHSGKEQRIWRFPSRSECMVCHSRQANFVLGIIGEQLNRDHNYGGIRDNQLRTLKHVGLISGSVPKGAKDLARIVDPYDASADLDSRVRSYLHVNCAPCHVEAGGGNAKMELEITRKGERLNLIGARPQHDTFGLNDAMLVAPGAPERSVLLYRLSRRGPGQMPPLVSHRVDEDAVRLLREWIAQLKPDKPQLHEWKMSELMPKLATIGSGRSFAAGQTAFREAGCNQCHRFAGAGGTVGPDLAGVGRRLAPRELLESILEPSKVVADEYASHDFELLDGETVSGRIEREDGRTVVLRPVASEASATEIEKKKIRRRQKSALSPMPAAMANILTEEQVLDLMAYLISDGNPDHPCFK